MALSNGQEVQPSSAVRLAVNHMCIMATLPTQHRHQLLLSSYVTTKSACRACGCILRSIWLPPAPQLPSSFIRAVQDAMRLLDRLPLISNLPCILKATHKPSEGQTSLAAAKAAARLRDGQKAWQESRTNTSDQDSYAWQEECLRML